ncbi:MAG TPA: hypothetical protein VGG46_04875 [Terriglobales bacterium]|jgi:hypothetical protein
MNNRVFRLVVRSIVMLALAAGTGAMAQTPKHNMEFRGTLNDYTPASAPASVKGPWEVRGHWSLLLNARSDKANFSAALTMERSDLGVMANGVATSTDPNLLDNPANRNAHTHHISVVNGEVTAIPGGFEVTGPATITINGTFPPPFQPAGTPSPVLTIDITGVTGSVGDIALSNIAVTFGDPATVHFGANPLHGVVRVARTLDEHDLRFRY